MTRPDPALIHRPVALRTTWPMRRLIGEALFFLVAFPLLVVGAMGVLP